MARVDVSGIDEIMKVLSNMSDPAKVEAAAKKAVEKGSTITVKEMAAAIASREYGPYSTGSVSKSVKATPAKKNAYGVFSVAKPTGRDEKGTRNAEKAAYLQYGTPKMPARPWAERAKREAEERAVPDMEDVFFAYIGELGGST